MISPMFHLQHYYNVTIMELIMKKMLCYCRESTMHPSPGALLGWSLGSYLGYWSGLGLSVVRLTVRWMLEGGGQMLQAH